MTYNGSELQSIFLSLTLSVLTVGVAFSASSAVYAIWRSVFGGEFMAVFAMRFRSVLCAIGFSAERKTFCKNPSFRGHDLFICKPLQGAIFNAIRLHSAKFRQVGEEIFLSFYSKNYRDSSI